MLIKGHLRKRIFHGNVEYATLHVQLLRGSFPTDLCSKKVVWLCGTSQEE